MVSTRLQSGCANGPSTSTCGSSSPPSSTSTDIVPHGHTVIVSPPSFSSYSNHQPLSIAKSTSSMNILHCPNEILEKILSYVDFKTVSNLRLVNRRFDTVCGQILSSTFMKLQNTMLHRFQSIKAKMPRRESARRQHPLACESDIIEMLHMRLTLLQMSFGKHIERKHCCFFAGEILDEIYRIITYIKTTPRLARPYKVTDELFDLSTMAMEYFKEKIEPTLPEITYFGTDFMDIASSFSASKNDAIQCGSDSCAFDSSLELSPRSPPQSNMVLRKRIHKIKQGMKRYSSQLTLMKRELKLCKTKLVDQQKTVVEYATRLDEYDKKNEDTSRKFSNVLQELNKCKTELQFFRSKFPFNPDCTCGSQSNQQPLVANEPPLLVQDNVVQVLSAQAAYLASGSLDEMYVYLESANIAVEEAAEPLTGSASPRADQDEGLVPSETISKKQGRGRNGSDGHSSDTELSTKKQSRNSTRSATNNVSGNEDSGSDHETSSTNNRKQARNNTNQQESVSIPSTSSGGITGSIGETTWNVRTKKRKSSGVICETKMLRGGSSIGFNVCKRSRR